MGQALKNIWIEGYLYEELDRFGVSSSSNHSRSGSDGLFIFGLLSRLADNEDQRAEVPRLSLNLRQTSLKILFLHASFTLH